MPLLTPKELMREADRRDCASWLRWMIDNNPPLDMLVVRDATAPVADVAAWSYFMTADETRDKFRTFDLLPVELDRVLDPLRPTKALIRWRVLRLPAPYWEQDAA